MLPDKAYLFPELECSISRLSRASFAGHRGNEESELLSTSVVTSAAENVMQNIVDVVAERGDGR